eukprot:758698-Rhodomonas_salina.1
MPRHEKKVEDHSLQIQTAKRLQKTADSLLEGGDSKSAQQKYSDAIKAVDGLKEDDALDIRFACGLGLATAGATRKKKSTTTRNLSTKQDSAPPSPKDGKFVPEEDASRRNTERRASRSPSTPLTSPLIEVYGKYMIATGQPVQHPVKKFTIAPYKSTSRPASVMSNPLSPGGGEPKASPPAPSLASILKEEKVQRARIPPPITPGPDTALRNQRLSPTKSWGGAPQPLRNCQMKEDYVTELLRLEEERKKREKEREREKLRLAEMDMRARGVAPEPAPIPVEAPP